MKVHKVPYSLISQLSHRDITYIQQAPKLKSFYKYSPELSSFKKVIEDKSKDATPRKALVEVLQNQYNNLNTDNAVGKNIQRLDASNTFTVTTAHQPSLFTGPLYYVYKIFSVIHLSRQLNEVYPDYQFIPMFVTGGEDHDFEEVNHFRIFGKKIVWGTNEEGAVGTFKTEHIFPVLDELEKILGDSAHAQRIFSILEKSHKENSVYSDAVIELLHELFGEYGLVILNMNQPELKRLFIPVFKQEILEQRSAPIVNETIAELEKKGFKAQAKPRELNLFYLKPQLRSRIVYQNGSYQVLDTDIFFSKTEILQELDKHPERFSPNVIIRPLYQEYILPNLAYVGGGGEIAYWLERKKQFEHFSINFPMLIRRNSVLWIDKQQIKKLNKLSLNVEDIFQDTDGLIKAYINAQTQAELSLKEEKTAFEALFDKIIQKAEEVDPTLGKKFEGEKVRQMKNLDQMEGRLTRAEKQKHETAVNQITNLKEKLFPSQGLQERHDNFLSFYLRNGEAYFETLLRALNPLDSNFVVITED